MLPFYLVFLLHFLRKGVGGTSVKKNLPTNAPDVRDSLGQEDTLKKDTATHSSILAWRIPWTEEPGGLQSIGSERVGYN